MIPSVRELFSTDRTGPLSNPDFRRIFVSAVITKLGYWVTFIAAMTIFVFETEIGPNEIGIFGLAGIVPNLLVSPVFGVFADRLERRKIVIVTELGGAVAVSALAVYQSLLFGYVVIFLVGCFRAASKPARKALVEQVIDDEETLSKANGLISGGKSVAQVLGPSLAGLLIIFVEPELLFLGDAVTYLVSVALFLRISAYDVTGGQDESVRSQFVSGLSAVVNSERIVAILLINLLLYSFLGIFDAMLPYYTREVLSLGSSEFGVMVSVIAGGATLAGLVVGSAGDRIGEVTAVAAAMVLNGITMLCLAVFDVFPVAVVGSGTIGFATSVAISYSVTFIQRTADSETLGRVFGIYDGLMSSGEILAIVVGSAIVARFNVIDLYVLMGGLFIACGGLLSVARSSERTPFRGQSPADEG
jgi:MFS family permease